tara:strand:- start:324 stop:959 length:636 start_codon:yes stop_codon:yes gene_type:complete
MQSIKPNIKINKLLDYSKEIKVKNNKLPKIIIIFNEEFFDEKKLLNLKIPKKSAFLLRSYKAKERKKIAKQLLKFCKMKELKLLIASDIKLAKDINAHGVHFPEYMIKEKNKINWVILKNIKLKKNWIITTAAHSLQSIKKAEFFDIDAALLSPVFSSKSHPNRKNLGINKFAKIVKKTKLPIYALGGINIKNIKSLIETDIIGYAFQRGI